MEHCIYHSRDLDGLTSGAIIKSFKNQFKEDCILTGYHYGEKLDTRKFKGKSTVMIDVSMPMERMELLGTNALEFIWIDHHVSAKNDFLEYCRQKEYEVNAIRFSDLIMKYECNKMNMTYYYSERLSGCEIAYAMYGSALKRQAVDAVRMLGQYDTWRQCPEKKFMLDRDWENEVLPFQYFGRTLQTPREVLECLRKIDQHDSKYLEHCIEVGSLIWKYQQSLNKTIGAAHFQIELNGLNIIALNTPLFNSNSFKDYYYPEVYDAMMPFKYNGATNRWEFSLYTDKAGINILSIAKELGGGGHAQACGFSLPANMVHFVENKIIFSDKVEDEKKSQQQKEANRIDPKALKEKPSKKSHVFREDKIGTWYLVPNLMSRKFDEMLEEKPDDVLEEFSKYIVPEND